MNNFKPSGYYELDMGVKNIPAHILGYTISINFEQGRTGEGPVDMSFQEMANAIGSPGRVLSLTSESLFELAQKSEDELSTQDFHIVGLAGERMLRIQKKYPLQWIEECYQSINQKTAYAS